MSMLVVGGIGSLSGAVAGVLVVSVVGEILRRFEDGVVMFGYVFTGPTGLKEAGISALMLAVLVLKPGGIMGGNELSLPWRWRREGRAVQGIEEKIADSGEKGQAN